MSEKIANVNIQKFAAAYIQTLPHSKKRDEFSSDEEYKEYLADRRKNYFRAYAGAVKFAEDNTQKLTSEESSSDET